MPPDPPGGARPAGPVVLRIKLRYDDVDAMVSRFAPNVGKSGLFLPTKSLQPVGSEVKFELRLSNDTPVLLGLGRVKVTKPPDPENPKASFGMAIELMRVTRESRDVILRMLERRKQLGLPEVQIPLPADLDAARRSDFVDTAVKGPVSAPVPAAVESQASEALLTAPRRPSGPVAVAKVLSIDPLPPEPPRPRRRGLAELIESASGPIAAVTVPGLDDDVDVAAVLARARALAGGDLDRELEALRESQAAPIEISVEAASAELARQLGGLAIRRTAPTAWAPPPAIAADKAQPVEPPVEVEAEVAPPAEAAAEATPAVDAQPDEPPARAADDVDPVTRAGAVHAKDRADSNAERPATPDEEEDELDEGRHAMRTRMVSRDELAKAAAAFDAPSERFIPKSFSFDTRDPVAPEPIDTLADPAAAAAALDHYETRTPISTAVYDEEHEVEPEQIHDEIHQLGEADYEEVEHTTIGAMPQPNAFEEHVFNTTPSMQRELADKLDEHLAEVEAEGEHDDLGIGEASGSYQRARIGLPPAQIYEGDQPGEPEPELDAAAVAVPQPVTLPPEYQQDFIHRFEDPGATIDAYGQTMDAGALGAPEDVQEIDDFEILAEADEEDEDLLSSSGEADASGQEQALPPGEGELAMPESDLELPPGVSDFSMPAAGDSDFVIPAQADFEMPQDELEMPAPRESDFAMRLDLGDDEPPPEPAPEPVPSEYRRPHSPSAVPQPVNLAASAGHALAAFDDDLDEASNSFTYADAPQLPNPIDFDDSLRFTPPSRFDQSDVLPLAQQGRAHRPSRHPDPVADPPTHAPYVLQGPPPAVSWDDEHSSRNRWASPSAPPAPSEEIDLESALEALDVDLDDLSSTPHGPTELARESRVSGQQATIRPPSSSQLPEAEPKRKSTRIPRGRAPRASTEDGVLIDFDDDDER